MEQRVVRQFEREYIIHEESLSILHSDLPNSTYAWRLSGVDEIANKV